MGEKMSKPNPSPDIENSGARNRRKNDCVAQCLDFLDRADNGVGFNKCVNECMKRTSPKGCK